MPFFDLITNPTGWAVPALTLLLALLIDRLWGEPPVCLHPVVWIGNYLGWAGRRVQRVALQQTVLAEGELAAHPKDHKAFWLAALYWCAGAVIFTIASWGLQQTVLAMFLQADGFWPVWPTGTVVSSSVFDYPVFSPLWLRQLGLMLLAALVLALLLKPMLAWAMLKSEVLAVEQALDSTHGGSLAGGRERLSWLVSRDVTQLTEAQVRESAIETLAENLNDSVVAPIFWFVLLGLPGAALYRFANTADAMWGYPGVYQGRNWAWAGKWAARADDVLSWLPARLTAVLLALMFWFDSLANARPPRMDVTSTGRIGSVVTAGMGRLRAEAHCTPSPNSGWPMAAMALGLGVSLHKPGVYVLNAAGRSPQPQDMLRAVVYASKALVMCVFIAHAALIFAALWGSICI